MKIDSSISPSLIRLLSVPLWWWFFGFPVLYKYCSPSWRPYLFVASFITHWIWDLDFFVLNLISCWLFDFIFQKKGKLRFLSRLGNDIQYGLRTEMQIQEFNFFVSSAMYNVDFIKQYDYFAEKKQQTLLSLLWLFVFIWLLFSWYTAEARAWYQRNMPTQFLGKLFVLLQIFVSRVNNPRALDVKL